MASSFPPSQCQLQWRSAQEVSHCLHPPTGSRAGEGVPFQPLPDPAQAGGDRAHNVPIRAPGQDLVSEPEDEVEKGAQASQHQDPLLQLGLRWNRQLRSDRLFLGPRGGQRGRLALLYLGNLYASCCVSHDNVSNRSEQHKNSKLSSANRSRGRFTVKK